MKHHDQVADAFGSTAAAYLTSPSHASGADLETPAVQPKPTLPDKFAEATLEAKSGSQVSGFDALL